MTVRRKDTNAALDISGVSTKPMKWKAPDGTIDTHTYAFVNSGTDGIVKFTTTATTDLDQAGQWEAFVYIDDAGGTGYVGYSEPHKFNVLPIPE